MADSDASGPIPALPADQAAREIFSRYVRRLIALARSRLDQQTRRKVDPEDVVQSALRSFFERQADGRVSVGTWDDLWNLLAVITLRKCRRQATALRARRRDVRREIPISGGDDAGEWEFAGREPTPDEVAILLETVERLFEGASAVERDIVVLRLQGYSPPEIAAAVGGISERKVYRVLEQVRKRLRDD